MRMTFPDIPKKNQDSKHEQIAFYLAELTWNTITPILLVLIGIYAHSLWIALFSILPMIVRLREN